MKTQITLKGVAGKTIAASAHDYNEAILVFDDGTFLRLEARGGYEGTADLEDDGALSLGDCHSFHVGIGIVTQAEIDEHRAERERKRAQAQTDNERATYERLRRKFEGGAA